MHSGSFINIGPVSIGFHVTPLFIGIFTMILYSERFKKNPVTGSGAPFEIISVDHAYLLQEEIEKFKSKFKDKPTESLTELCSDAKYSTSAKEAAKQILNERLNQELSSH